MKPLVLLVDDTAEIRAFLRRSLGDKVRVVEAPHGEEALLQIQREPPDLVVMDLEMPVMDGLVAAAEMRKLPVMQGIPLIALTGHPDPALIQRAKACGFSYFVRKEADARPFVEKVLELAWAGRTPPEEM